VNYIISDTISYPHGLLQTTRQTSNIKLISYTGRNSLVLASNHYHSVEFSQ